MDSLGNIIVLIILVLSIVQGILSNSKNKKEAAKRLAETFTESTEEDSATEQQEPQERVYVPISEQTHMTSNLDNSVASEETLTHAKSISDNDSEIDFDIEKAIIYSEILKPKFKD